jgi:hypothetical protein
VEREGVTRSEGEGEDEDDLQEMRDIDARVDLASSVSSTIEHIISKPTICPSPPRDEEQTHIHNATLATLYSFHFTLSLPLYGLSLLFFNLAITGYEAS